MISVWKSHTNGARNRTTGSAMSISYSLVLFRITNKWPYIIFSKEIHVVSPPQMPVPLKRMYNANILRAEITTFVPNCPPMWHNMIKPKLSFLKNSFENGMLTSCVLSYTPMLVKRSVLPRSPEIFLRPFLEKTQILFTPCVHPKIPHNSYTSYHR